MAAKAVAIVVANRRLICRSIHHLPWPRGVIAPAMLNCSLDYGTLNDFHFADSLVLAIITNLPTY
jgi:hypothetical protein